ncbi:hypothetical protein ECZU23_51990 [Escherichia coli]|nr:hypothetical protein [Escherichia coli]GHL00483.1 hypothetical protein ECZU20_52320 [Escherichia coli]GHL16756.1 hypothetical protein ECZU23_51990 [Escherichia coli]GHM31375.1 hypothetical protein ECZU45_51620 [Escherichia coli]
MVTVFGILNLTEDSFFDESRRLDPPALSPRRSKCCESDQTSWMSDRPPAIRTRGLYRRPMRSDVLRRS